MVFTYEDLIFQLYHSMYESENTFSRNHTLNLNLDVFLGWQHVV